MKAWVTTGGSVALTDVPEPAPTPDEALVEVHAVAVNRGELGLAANLPAGSPLGWDVAGVVVRAADDGTGPTVGTRVFGLADRTGWAERAALNTARVAVIPDVLDDTAAAALPVAGLTALYALRRTAAGIGDTVLVTAAGGGVGRVAVQLAAVRGARVLASVGSPDRAEGVRADRVSTYDEPVDEPVDVLLDSVGGAVLRDAFAAVRRGGRVLAYGNTSRVELSLPADWGHARPGVTLTYLHLFDEATRHPVPRDLAALADLAARGALDPGVALRGSWTDVPAALAALADRRLNGKAVLTLG